MSDKAVQSQAMGYDSYPGKLGDLMRGERATLGKSLLDVQRALRIKAAYIAAIENCDTTVFQTPGFIAGYVRSYARYLGLDPEETFEHFCRESSCNGTKSQLHKRPKLPGVTPFKATISLAKADPLVTPRVPFVPAQSGFMDSVSASGLGSVMVLLVLILGLGYGAWAVLQDIQRVEFAPVDEPADVIATTDTGAVTEDQTSITEAALERLYRPQELEVPVMVTRDGPIAGLDPNRVGALLPSNGDSAGDRTTSETALAESPRVTEPAAPQLAVVATRPAWVRVTLADGSILFEKILNGGESFQLPQLDQPTILRAGNAGAVYLTLDGAAFGPVGQGTSVVKDVSLALAEITEKFKPVKDTAELKALDSPRVITLNDIPASQ